MKYTFEDYYNQLVILVKGNTNKLSLSEGGGYDKSILYAASIYNNDKPHFINFKVTHEEGKKDYNLNDTFGGLWSHSCSSIDAIEYPLDNDPPEYLEPKEDYYIYDDGMAQDGSNKVLRFSSAPSGDFVVKLRIELSLTREGGQNWDHNSFDFTAITTLAAVLACKSLASAYAESVDATISADSVDYKNVSRKYLDLSDDYQKIYNKMVFGDENAEVQVKPAMLDVDLDPIESSSRGSYLFHR